MRNLSTHFEYNTIYFAEWKIHIYHCSTAATAARRSSRNQQPTIATTGDEFADRVALEAIENLSETIY
jgi:hypothetical protein